jgi:hypothetical protein
LSEERRNKNEGAKANKTGARVSRATKQQNKQSAGINDSKEEEEGNEIGRNGKDRGTERNAMIFRLQQQLLLLLRFSCRVCCWLWL